MLNEVIKVLKQENIPYEDYYILIENEYFNGEYKCGVVLSKDHKYVTIPIIDEEMSICYNEDINYPHCFEIHQEYRLWINNGSYRDRVNVKLLKK